MPKTENHFYNQEVKETFLGKQIESAKRSFTTIFNSFSKYEFMLNKDLFDFSKSELVDAMLSEGKYTYKTVNQFYSLMSKYFEYHGRSFYINEVDIKEEMILKKKLYYPRDGIDFFESIIFAVNEKSAEDGWDESEYYQSCITYALLLYYNLSDKEIRKIKRSDFYGEQYICANGLTIDNALFNFIKRYAKTDGIVIYRQSSNAYGDDLNPINRVYQNRTELMRSISHKINNNSSTSYNSISELNKLRELQKYCKYDLNKQDIIISGIFYRAFQKEINELRKFTVEESMRSLRNNIDYYTDLLSSSLIESKNMLALAEKYTLYKMVRMKYNL